MNRDGDRSYDQSPADATEKVGPLGPSADVPFYPQRARAAVILLAILSALTLVTFKNPQGQAYFPRCPTEQYLHVYCPGCGSTRATHHMLNGRFGTAMHYNPLMVIVGLPLGSWYLTRTVVFIAAGKRVRVPGIPPALGWVALVVVVSYMVVRNLPGAWPAHLRPPPALQDHIDTEPEAVSRKEWSAF